MRRVGRPGGDGRPRPFALAQPAGCPLGAWDLASSRIATGHHQPGLTWLLLCREWRCHSPVLAWSGAPVSPQRAPPSECAFHGAARTDVKLRGRHWAVSRSGAVDSRSPGPPASVTGPCPPILRPRVPPRTRALLVCSERGSWDPKNPIQRVSGRTCRPLFCELELVPRLPVSVCQAVSLRLSVRLCGCSNRTTPHPAGSRLGLCSCPRRDRSGFAPVL